VSFPKETMLELMSYADGDELDAASRARVEELLRTSDEARRVVDAMGSLGEVVREGAEDRLGRSVGIADGVMAAIAGGANVVPIGQARRSRVGAATAVMAALAVAAGVLFFVTFDKPGAPAPVASAAHEPVGPAAASAALAQTETAPGVGVDLEEVRSIENKVNVFFVPKGESANAANATSSVVVWIDDRHGAH
jgi:hypothetical protein